MNNSTPDPRNAPPWAPKTPHYEGPAIERSRPYYSGDTPSLPPNWDVPVQNPGVPLAEILTHVFGSKGWDDGVLCTAERVMRYWQEFATPPAEIGCQLPFNFTTFEAEAGQMIFVGDIEFASLCSHHLLPILGKAHVAYIANELQVGLSKIPRLIDFWARRPQVQERLTHQIAKDLKKRLNPHGVMVVIDAQHTCMCARGVRAHNGTMRTSLPIGLFMSSDSARQEFFALASLR